MSANEAETTEEAEEEQETVTYRETATSEWSWSAVVSGTEFREALRAAGELIGDPVLELSRDGFTVEGCCPANVAYSRIEYESDDIVEPGVLAGDWGVRTRIDAAALSEQLDHYGGYEVTVTHYPTRSEKGSSLTVQPTADECYDPEPQKWEIDTQDPNRGYRMLPEEPPVPDDGVDVELPAYKLRGVLGALADAVDGAVRLTPTEDAIAVDAQNHHNDDTWRGPWPIAAEGITPGDSSLYSADFIADLTNALAPDEPVRIRFAHEHILRLDQGTRLFAIAPRIDDKHSDDGGDGDE